MIHEPAKRVSAERSGAVDHHVVRCASLEWQGKLARGAIPLASGCGVFQKRKLSEFDEVIPVSIIGFLGRAEDHLVPILVRFLDLPVEIRHKE